MNHSRLLVIAFVTSFTLFINLFVPQAISASNSCTPSYVGENLKPKGQINGCKNVSIRIAWDPEYVAWLKVNPIGVIATDVPRLAELYKVPTDKWTIITLGDLNGLNFQGSTLVKADFIAVNLAGSKFVLAKGSPPSGNIGLRIVGSNLNDADFSSSTMNSVQIKNSSLKRANLQKSKFKGAKLTYSDFSGANFNRADFSGADFTGSSGCGIKGKPSKLPTSVKLVKGCLIIK